MCQAIYKPAGVQVDKATLKRAWQENQDGAGFCYVNNEKTAVVIKKGFFKFKAFWYQYEKHAHKDVLIHFRYATHGGKVSENCHPFAIAKDAALIHNGILSGFTPLPTSTLSDTRIFCDGYLSQGLRLSGLSSYEYLSSPALRGFVETIIGSTNKLAVMTPQGTVLFNEAQGEWYQGAWYSAGYPMIMPVHYGGFNRVNSYFHKGRELRSSGREVEGADDWLEDILNDDEEPRKPLSGRLTWDELIDTEISDHGTDEDYPYDDWDTPRPHHPYSEEQEACTFCHDSTGKLYQVDDCGVCGRCWLSYTGKA
jgi:hypothetical protein